MPSLSEVVGLNFVNILWLIISSFLNNNYHTIGKWFLYRICRKYVENHVGYRKSTVQESYFLLKKNNSYRNLIQKGCLVFYFIGNKVFPQNV